MVKTSLLLLLSPSPFHVPKKKHNFVYEDDLCRNYYIWRLTKSHHISTSLSTQIGIRLTRQHSSSSFSFSFKIYFICFVKCKYMHVVTCDKKCLIFFKAHVSLFYYDMIYVTSSRKLSNRADVSNSYDKSVAWW